MCFPDEDVHLWVSYKKKKAQCLAWRKSLNFQNSKYSPDATPEKTIPKAQNTVPEKLDTALEKTPSAIYLTQHLGYEH